MTDPYLVTLRAIHVLAAVFWAGGTFVLAWHHEFVINPGTPRETLARMASYDDMSKRIGFAGLLAALSGILLYWEVSLGLDDAWLASTYGTVITLGAAAGILSFLVAIPMVGMANNRAAALDDEAGEELTDEQRAEVDRLYARQHKGERWIAVLLGIAVLAMATAQYL